MVENLRSIGIFSNGPLKQGERLSPCRAEQSRHALKDWYGINFVRLCELMTLCCRTFWSSNVKLNRTKRQKRWKWQDNLTGKTVKKFIGTFVIAVKMEWRTVCWRDELLWKWKINLSGQGRWSSFLLELCFWGKRQREERRKHYHCEPFVSLPLTQNMHFSHLHVSSLHI